MKHIITILALVYGSAYACDTSMSNAAFYNCINYQQQQQYQQQQMIDEAVRRSQQQQQQRFCYRDSFNNLICQ